MAHMALLLLVFAPHLDITSLPARKIGKVERENASQGKVTTLRGRDLLSDLGCYRRDAPHCDWSK